MHVFDNLVPAGVSPDGDFVYSTNELAASLGMTQRELCFLWLGMGWLEIVDGEFTPTEYAFEQGIFERPEA